MSENDDGSTVDSQIITFEEARENLQATSQESNSLESNFNKKFEDLVSQSQPKYSEIKAKGLKDHFKHKECWSYFIMFILGVIVVFQCVLVTGVGLKWFDFMEYKWLLPTLMIQYLTQVVGLAVLVVKSLFKDFDYD